MNYYIIGLPLCGKKYISNLLYNITHFNIININTIIQTKYNNILLNIYNKYKHNTYLDIEYQEENFKEFSDLLGWNTIRRRNIGYLEALKNNYDIIASIDDDNIPLENWGKNLLLGKEVEVYYYETDSLCFDSIGVTNYKHLWHRGYPIQELYDRDKNYKNLWRYISK